jgi:alpha,alpha-trehalase
MIARSTTDRGGPNIAIAIEYANRYMLSSFCSWYATGGAIPGLLEALPDSAREGNPDDAGHMFEKFNS